MQDVKLLLSSLDSKADLIKDKYCGGFKLMTQNTFPCMMLHMAPVLQEGSDGLKGKVAYLSRLQMWAHPCAIWSFVWLQGQGKASFPLMAKGGSTATYHLEKYARWRFFFALSGTEA